MRGYSSAKSHPFQFGVPFHKYPRSNEEHGEFGDNFYKMLCSWLNFRDLISRGSIAEVDKIRNVFSAMFQADQKQMVKKQKKSKFRETPHIVKIDLDKIDENLNLSSKEKRRLRRILNKIKYRELGKQSNKKEVKRRKEKPAVFSKTKKIVTEKNLGRTRREQSTEKSKERNNWQRGECRSKHCNLCSGDKSHAKRNQKRFVTTITPSEERVFKTLMNLDRTCCADSFKTLFDPKRKRTFTSKNQNINIENLELKYIQPTCLVQYTGTKRVLSIDVLSQAGSTIYPKESFSLAALRAMTKQYNDDARSNCFVANSLHTTRSKPTEIDEADETFERTRLTCQQNKQGEFFGDLDFENHRQSLKSFRDEVAKRDFEVSGTSLASGDQLMSPRRNFEELDHKQITLRNNMEYLSELDIPKKRSSKYRKLKNFAKKFLCLCGTEDSRDRNTPRHRRKDRDVNCKLRKRCNSPDDKFIYD